MQEEKFKQRLLTNSLSCKVGSRHCHPTLQYVWRTVQVDKTVEEQLRTRVISLHSDSYHRTAGLNQKPCLLSKQQNLKALMRIPRSKQIWSVWQTTDRRYMIASSGSSTFLCSHTVSVWYWAVNKCCISVRLEIVHGVFWRTGWFWKIKCHPDISLLD